MSRNDASLQHRILRLLAGGAIALASGGCMLFGVRTGEEARYTVVRSSGDIEVRDYAPVVVARTFVAVEDWDEAGGVGFRRLAKYIFGGNAGEQDIAMTAPVLLESAGQDIAMTSPVLLEREERGWQMTFVLPSEYTLESAPRPVDEEVEIALADARRVAVLRYSGSFSEDAAREKAAELQAWLSANGVEALSEPVVAGFDPPWTLPPWRRNEIWISVQ